MSIDYYRKGAIIYKADSKDDRQIQRTDDGSGHPVEHFHGKFINEAKRESRNLQQSGNKVRIYHGKIGQ